MIIGGQTYIDGKLRVPDIWLRDVMVGGQFVFVFEVSVLDVLCEPILGEVEVVLGDGEGDPGKGLEEGVVLLLVSLSITGNTALEELLLFKVKMVAVQISVEVQQVDIGWVLTQSLHGIKQTNMFLIQSVVLKAKIKIKSFKIIIVFISLYLH